MVRGSKVVSANSAVLLVIPIVLSMFVHLWNPVGFPGIHGDEGHYIRRGIHVSDGLGPQEPTSNYDHPYFGWLFLSSIFSITNYPESLNATAGDVESIEAVWAAPRLIVGVLAVLDTILVYKITERRYNTKIAFIAAILFAVMPFSWMLRRVFLESVQLPLLLFSVLFAIYIQPVHHSIGQSNRQRLVLPLLSGIFLGLAIFTKVPAFTFIPLVGYLIFTNSKKSFKSLGVYIAPVILIPLIWPAYAISVNEYDKWLDGIDFQTSRASKPLMDGLNSFFSTDAMLLVLGIGGTIYAAILKRDIFFILWISPFLVFLYFIDYVSSFFLIPLLAPFCIASGVMIVDLSTRIARKKRRLSNLLPFIMICAIGILGISITTSLIIKSQNSDYLEVISSVSEQLPETTSRVDAPGLSEGQSDKDKMTIVGSPSYYWILQYVFDKPQYNYKTQYNLISKNTIESIVDQSEKVILIADKDIIKVVNNETKPDTLKAKERADRLRQIYDNSDLTETIGDVQIRTNF